MEQFNRLMGALTALIIVVFMAFVVVSVTIEATAPKNPCGFKGTCAVVENDASSRFNNPSRK